MSKTSGIFNNIMDRKIKNRLDDLCPVDLQINSQPPKGPAECVDNLGLVNRKTAHRLRDLGVKDLSR